MKLTGMQEKPSRASPSNSHAQKIIPPTINLLIDNRKPSDYPPLNY
jgi:hypothetical protein